MEQDKTLAIAKQFYDQGFAILWLHPKSKRPVDSGWTKGPRHPWLYLRETYRPELNLGVRLGEASKVGGGFLGVIDVDVKSTEPRHVKEVEAKLDELLHGKKLPEVKSGRGNGSRHLYITTPKPITPSKAFQSLEVVRVLMPSAKPSKRDLAALSPEEIEAGYRMRAAWEIAFMGQGQQVVLPPSVHPDSGKRYTWQSNFDAGLAAGFDEEVLKHIAPIVTDAKPTTAKAEPKAALDGFEVVPVELSWLPLAPKIKAMIETGEGVEDRSAMLLPISKALLNAGLTRNEILTVLTDPDNYIGPCSFEHAKTKDRARAARWVYSYTLARVMNENSSATMFSAPLVDDITTLSEEERAKQQAAFDAQTIDWRLTLDQTKDDRVKSNLRNVVMILENEVGPDMIRHNSFAYRDFYSVNTPWGGVVDAALTDKDKVQIKLWLSNTWGFEPNSNIVSEALTIMAARNSFDPVLDWLDGLPEWDGVERLDGWLKKNFCAQGHEEYLAQVFRKWMVAMVMRIYKPGAKFDWMPIFEGAQGVGKSSFGRLLCGDKYFLDWLPDLMNKDSALALQGIWSVEMGELASFRKNEIEAVKAFVTRTVDKVRPPYGERWLEVPRRCVFFGTTNFETYLRDDSGNRRFKPVKVGRLNFDALEEERTQLFCEAKMLYQTGFETERTLEIDGEGRAYEIEIQAAKMVSDDSALMLEILHAFIEQEKAKPKGEQFSFEKFTMRDLFGARSKHPFAISPLEDWKYDSRNVQLAGKALKALGATNSRSHGVKYYKIKI